MLFSTSMTAPAYGQEACDKARSTWEQTVERVKQGLKRYESVRATSLKKIAGRPLVRRDSAKTIAQQIAEVVEAKEQLLAEERGRCMSLLSLEQEAFQTFAACMEQGARSGRALSRVKKERERLVKKALVRLAEVREVEGRETHYPQYVGSWQSPGAYYRQPRYGGYGAYQQMYRQYWGR
jgi:hypothetical protein